MKLQNSSKLVFLALGVMMSSILFAATCPFSGIGQKLDNGRDMGAVQEEYATQHFGEDLVKCLCTADDTASQIAWRFLNTLSAKQVFFGDYALSQIWPNDFYYFVNGKSPESKITDEESKQLEEVFLEQVNKASNACSSN